jgi:hypothetical protein
MFTSTYGYGFETFSHDDMAFEDPRILGGRDSALGSETVPRQPPRLGLDVPVGIKLRAALTSVASELYSTVVEIMSELTAKPPPTPR